MRIEHVRLQICSHLESITNLFKPGVKITLIVRHKDPEQDLLMTDDNLSEVSAALERAKLREANQGEH